MQEIFKGCAWTFGNDINTESIMPSHVHHDIYKSAEICMEFYDPEFPKSAKPGDFVIAGTNFGNSSSRPAVGAFIAMKLSAVICESAARIFVRNSWNLAFPILECKGITEMVSKGDELEVNIVTGKIKNLTTNKEIQAEKPLDVQLDRLRAGGYLQWIVDQKEHFNEIA